MGERAERTYTQAELDQAISAIKDPERLRAAQSIVARVAPTLDDVLGRALFDGGWFGGALEGAVRGAAAGEDAEQRVRAMSALLAEETRLAMLVGVAVGFELAHELDQPQ